MLILLKEVSELASFLLLIKGMANTKMVECAVCGFDFDPKSRAKQAAGGRINECPDCSVETAVRYVGLANGDGKQASIDILAFESVEDADEFTEAWKQNTGFYRGKSCQMGARTPISQRKFKQVARTEGNSNHKGRA